MRRVRLFNRYDILIMVVSLTAAALAAVLLYTSGSGATGGYVRVSVRGRVVATLSLDQDVEGYEIKTDEGFNMLSVANGSARVTGADCPDGLCVRQNAVSRDGELIVCLPHGVVVEVIGLPGDVDATTR